MNQVIEVHIDRLVLHGFSPHDRYRIGDTVRAALYEKIAESGLGGVLSEGGSLPYIDAGAFDMTTGQSPSVTGENIADSVYKSFSNGIESGYRK